MNRITFPGLPNVGRRLKKVIIGTHLFGMTTHDGDGMVSLFTVPPKLSSEDWQYHFAVMSHALKEAP